MFIKFEAQAYIGFGLILLTLVILFYAVKQYIKANRISLISNTVKWIYIAIFCWATCNFAIT